jgi:hypothetical protein
MEDDLEALPFESPKLAVTANLHAVDNLGSRLAAAIEAKHKAGLLRVGAFGTAAKVLELKAEEHPAEELTKPFTTILIKGL